MYVWYLKLVYSRIPRWLISVRHVCQSSQGNCQITFSSQIRTKAVWLKREGYTISEGFIHCFISARDRTITLISLCIHVHFWKKLQSVPLKIKPPSLPHLRHKLPYKSLPAHDCYATQSLFTHGAPLDDWSRALLNFLNSPTWSKGMKTGG